MFNEFVSTASRCAYIPVIAAGTPIVSARLVGLEQLDTLSSPLQSLRRSVKSVFGDMIKFKKSVMVSKTEGV